MGSATRPPTRAIRSLVSAGSSWARGSPSGRGASSSTGTTPGSTACLLSRTTFFTGQYPSLHGGTNTDGMAKKANDPAMGWLDPNSVPTLGDWFRAGGYETHYRGKWHVSHADLLIRGTHEGLMASDDAGQPIPDAVAAYKGADRLDPTASPAGSAASRTARPRPTPVWCATACSPNRWSSSSLSWPPPAGTDRGWRWRPSSTPTTSPSTVGPGRTCSATRRWTTTRCPTHDESVITSLPTGAGNAAEVWKLNHYYERLDEFDQAHGLPTNPFAGPPADAAWELHNLSADPEERRNRVRDDADVLRDLQGVLDEQRECKRRLPRLRNRPADATGSAVLAPQSKLGRRSRVRLSSKNPSVAVHSSTPSHSRPAASPLGAGVTTGPKMAVPL
jgi:hypothetical protein